MVKFDSEEDRTKVIIGVLGRYFDHYLSVYLRLQLMCVGRFSRVCVDIDLNEVMVGSVGINREWSAVQYEDSLMHTM